MFYFIELTARDDWAPFDCGMVRSQVAGGGTASNVEGSLEYFEYAIADSRHVVVLQLGGWVSC